MKKLKISAVLAILAFLFSTATSFAVEDDGGGDLGGEGCACAWQVNNKGHCTYRFDVVQTKYFYKCSTPQQGEVKDCKGVVPCEEE